jgi:hypothetical protein
MRRAFLMALVGLPIAACATPSASRPQRFSGEWAWHFETSAFTTDDGQGPYWLAADGDLWPELTAPFNEAQNAPWGRAHVVVEGVLSGPGSYGHLGAYSRQLRVTRVISSRLISAREGSVR